MRLVAGHSFYGSTSKLGAARACGGLVLPSSELVTFPTTFIDVSRAAFAATIPAARLNAAAGVVSDRFLRCCGSQR
jgi:hypothetical protein